MKSRSPKTSPYTTRYFAHLYNGGDLTWEKREYRLNERNHSNYAPYFVSKTNDKVNWAGKKNTQFGPISPYETLEEAMAGAREENDRILSREVEYAQSALRDAQMALEEVTNRRARIMRIFDEAIANRNWAF